MNNKLVIIVFFFFFCYRKRTQFILIQLLNSTELLQLSPSARVTNPRKKLVQFHYFIVIST